MGQPFFVYILLCADKSYYVGQTDNLEKRFAEHQAGASSVYTSTRRPVELAWSQQCATRIEAKEAEAKIKRWSRAKKKALIKGDYQALRIFPVFLRIPRERNLDTPQHVDADDLAPSLPVFRAAWSRATHGVNVGGHDGSREIDTLPSRGVNDERQSRRTQQKPGAEFVRVRQGQVASFLLSHGIRPLMIRTDIPARQLNPRL